MTEDEKKVYEQIENAVCQLNVAIDLASRYGIEVDLTSINRQTISSKVVSKLYTFKATKVLG